MLLLAACLHYSNQRDMESMRTATVLPWEVLFLVSHFLQPETLLRASLVCKSWRQVFTSDHLWRPICAASYPSSLRLLISGISPYHLFSLFFSASKRRYNHPSPLYLSLNQLFFAVEIFHGKETLVSVIEEAVPRNDCTFRFEADLTEQNVGLLGEAGEMTASWTVVMKGLNGAFSMMEREGKGRAIGGDHTRIWFSEQMPVVPDCCKGLMPEGSDMEAEMVVEIGEKSNGRRVVQRVGLGLISGCRYVALEDGLRYLQYFLLGRDKIILGTR